MLASCGTRIRNRKRVIAAPPRHLPRTNDPQGTGATSISRRNPYSLSHTTDAAAIRAVINIDRPRTPGYKKVRDETHSLRWTRVVEEAEQLSLEDDLDCPNFSAR